jgi:hypothetical protein
VFENRVLRRIFGPTKDEVMGEWRKLHTEEMRDLHSLSSIITMIKSRTMGWERHVSRIGEKGNACRLWVVQPEGSGLPGRQRHRWVDNVKKDLGETGCGGADWSGLTSVRDKWRAFVGFHKMLKNY